MTKGFLAKPWRGPNCKVFPAGDTEEPPRGSYLGGVVSMGVTSVLEAGLGAKPEDLLVDWPALTAQVIGRLVVLPVLDVPIAMAG